MGKKRVCHVTSVHPADDIRILHKECVSLSNAGYEVYLVAPEVSNQLKNGIQIIGVLNKPVSRFHRILFYIRYVYKKALWVNADIYHLHDPELLLYALLLKKKER